MPSSRHSMRSAILGPKHAAEMPLGAPSARAWASLSAQLSSDRPLDERRTSGPEETRKRRSRRRFGDAGLVVSPLGLGAKNLGAVATFLLMGLVGRASVEVVSRIHGAFARARAMRGKTYPFISQLWFAPLEWCVVFMFWRSSPT